MILNFNGGAKINAKRLFEESQIEYINNCSAVCIKASEDAETDVAVGANVLKGDLLGFSFQTPVYASVSGVFNGIMDIEGDNYFVVMNNGEGNENVFFQPETKPLTQLTHEDIVNAARQYGIIDPRSGKPLWKLLEKAENFRRLVIDGTEPFAHSAINYRLFLENPKEIVFGAKIILHCIGALKCVFAMENSKKKAMEALNPYITDEKLFAIAEMEEKYPYGDMGLMQGIYLKELKSHQTASDKKVLIISPEAAIELYKSMVSGKVQTNRYITVCGEGLEKGGNFAVPRGITLHDITEICGKFPEDKLIIENSLLSGKPIGGVIKDSTIALITAAIKVKKQSQCISCGECINACPVKLCPNEILLKKNKNLTKKCVSCGACEYICPAGIPLLKMIKGYEEENNDN